MYSVLRKNTNFRIFNFLKNSLRDCSYSRLVRPRVNLVSRSKYFSCIALDCKSSDESITYVKSADNATPVCDPPASLSNAIDKALLDIDFRVRRTGRAFKSDVTEVLLMIENMSFASQIHGLYLLRSCGLIREEEPAQRVKLAEIIMKKLQNIGCQFDVRHFNSLLKVYVENNHKFDPSSFLTLMDSYKIEPNKVTYLYLMENYCNSGDLTGAGEILQFMKEKGLTINEAVFINLIKGHMKINDASGARDVLEIMRSSNLLPTAESYTALACGLAETRDIDSLEAIFQLAENENINLSNKNILSIISSLPSENLDYVNKLIGRLENVQDWKQDVLNTAIDLIHKDLDDMGFKLITAVGDSDDNYNSNIFTKQLVKSGKPVERIIRYCEELSDKNLSSYFFINCARAAIDIGKFDHAISLFEVMLQKGIPVRIRNFWPIFVYYKNFEEGIWKTLKQMSQLAIPADGLIYNDYVFPVVRMKNVADVISKLQETGQLMGAINHLFQYYCNTGDFDNALYLTENYLVHLPPNFNFGKCVSFYGNMKNKKSYLKVLNFVLMNAGLLDSKDIEISRGQNLALLIQTNPLILDSLIKNLKFEGYSQRSLDICYNILKIRAPEGLIHLRKLENYFPLLANRNAVTDEDLDLNVLKEKGLLTTRYAIDLLSYHIKTHNVDKVNKLLGELGNQNVVKVMPPKTYSQMFSLYCKENDIEKAKECFNNLKEAFPTYHLDSAKVFNYATLLIKFSMLSEAKEIIEKECTELHIFGNKDFTLSNLKMLFNAAIETGDCEFVLSLHSCLVCHAETLQSIKTLHEPLVKMHLHRNDLENAVEEFRKCAANYRITPCMHLLLKRCIITENQQNLQTVIDSSATIHGKHAVLHELTLAFVECGRKTQAMKILKSLGDKVDPSYVEDICNRLYEANKISELEGFISITHALENVDKEKLSYLFKVCAQKKDYKKALHLYNTMQKENPYDPSEKTKKLLDDFLLKTKVPIPFLASVEEVAFDTDDSNLANSPYTAEFINFVEKDDSRQSLQMLQKMNKGHIRSLPVNVMRQFIELLISRKCASDCSANVQAMSYIIENAAEILNPLFEKYSQDGNVEAMDQLSSFLPDFTLRKCSFNSFLGKAYISSGRQEELLTTLENCYDKKNKLFSIVAFIECLKITALQERVMNLAKKYLEVNFDLPIAVLWAYYFINENYDKANEVCKLQTVPVDKVDTMVIKAVRQKENVFLGKEYVEIINQLGGRSRSKERAYGALLDVLVLKEKYDDAVTLVMEAKGKGIDLEKQYRSTLITLKSVLERDQKEIPFTIPSEDFLISE